MAATFKGPERLALGPFAAPSVGTVCVGSRYNSNNNARGGGHSGGGGGGHGGGGGGGHGGGGGAQISIDGSVPTEMTRCSPSVGSLASTTLPITRFDSPALIRPAIHNSYSAPKAQNSYRAVRPNNRTMAYVRMARSVSFPWKNAPSTHPLQSGDAHSGFQDY